MPAGDFANPYPAVATPAQMAARWQTDPPSQGLIVAASRRASTPPARALPPVARQPKHIEEELAAPWAIDRAGDDTVLAEPPDRTVAPHRPGRARAHTSGIRTPRPPAAQDNPPPMPVIPLDVSVGQRVAA